MSKLYTGSIGFSVGIVQKGAVPLDDRSVVKSFNDLLNTETFGLSAYEGMLVAVVDEQQVYMLIDKANATLANSWIAVGSGNGSIAVNTYAEAVALATNDNIGQIIYVKTTTSIESEGETIEYDAAPYIVIGSGILQKLAASTASGDIEGDVSEIQAKLAGIEDGAQVNKIESITVNGVSATTGTNKSATITIEADDIELGTAITYTEKDENGEDVVNVEYAATAKTSSVLQSIQDSIRGAVNSVSAGNDKSVSVDNTDAKNPIISLNVEASTNATVNNGHIAIIKGDNGVYAAMYYDGDDV